MKLILNGRHLELTEAIKAHVQEKMNHVSSHFDFVKEIHLFLSVDKNPRIHDNHKAEATVHCLGAVVRIHAVSPNLYTSIDNLVIRLERALNKHKEKLLHRAKSGKAQPGETIRYWQDTDTEEASASSEKLTAEAATVTDEIFYTAEWHEESVSLN